MIMSARFLRDTQTVSEVKTSWVGKPMTDNEIVYVLFENAGEHMPERWYVYGKYHEARAIKLEDLPEAVRLAHMLLS